MTSTASSTASRVPDTASRLLAAARDERRAADRAEARLLGLAVAWAGLHVAEHLDDAERYGRPDVFGNGRGVPIAGPGAPLVSEYAAAEFAAAVGLGPEAGKRYDGHRGGAGAPAAAAAGSCGGRGGGGVVNPPAPGYAAPRRNQPRQPHVAAP